MNRPAGATGEGSFSKGQVNRAGRFLRDLYGASDGERLVDLTVNEAVQVVDRWRVLHARPLARVNAGLRYYVGKVSADEIDVTQRLKRFETIVDKLGRQPNMQLTTMEDIGGVRAVLSDQEQVDTILRDLRRQPRWNLRRVREYIDGRRPGPKADGYRAVHVIVEKDGRYVEIQLRTRSQDIWAQSVERDTRRVGAGLKFGTGPDDLRQYYRMVAEFFALREQGVEPDTEFMRRLSQLYHETQRYYS